MTMLCYKSDKFNDDSGLLQEWQVNDDKSNNNDKDKVCLLLKRWS